MSEPSPLRMYRANINLPRLRCGQLIEIDDSDGRWADWIDHGVISPVGPPADPYIPQAPWEDPDIPTTVYVPTDGTYEYEPAEVVVGDVVDPNPSVGDVAPFPGTGE